MNSRTCVVQVDKQADPSIASASIIKGTMFPASYFLLWVAFMCITLIYVWPFVQRYIRWLAVFNKIPGPSFIRITFHAMRFPIKGEAQYVKHNSLFAIKAGPLSLVMLCKAEAVKALLSSKTELNKAVVYERFKLVMGDSILTCNVNKWHQRRKLLTPCFNSQILMKFLVVMNEQAELLVHILDEKCRQLNGKELDICPFVSRCSLEIILETAMGQGVNAQIDKDHKYIEACDSLLQLVSTRPMKFWLSIDWIFRHSSLRKHIRRTVGIIKRLTNEIIKNKQKELSESDMANNSLHQIFDDKFETKRRMAFLEKLLQCSREESSNGGQPLTDVDILYESDVFINAGYHTSSATISWALHYIGAKPNVQQKIADELDHVYGECDRHSTSSDLHDLKYMDCVIKETLRLKPPVPIIGRRLSEDMNTCGCTIPAGTDVFVYISLVHRDPAHFPDPDSFNPDRFLPENSQDRDLYAFIPFSGGLRNCIGKKFGMMETKVVLAAILRRFKVTTVDSNLPANNFTDFLFTPLPNNRVILEPRNNY